MEKNTQKRDIGHNLKNSLQVIMSLTELSKEDLGCVLSLLRVYTYRMEAIQEAVKDMARTLEKGGL